MQIRLSVSAFILVITCLTGLATSKGFAGEKPIVVPKIEIPKGVIELEPREAPALNLKDMDGQYYNLEQSKGHWVFVHFWASWCGPCRREMPTIQDLAHKIDSKLLEIVLINTAETEDTVFSFIGVVAPDLNPLMDNDGLVTQSWQPRGLPSTYLVDAKGRIRYVALGGRPWDKAEYLNFLQSLISSK